MVEGLYGEEQVGEYQDMEGTLEVYVSFNPIDNCSDLHSAFPQCFNVGFVGKMHRARCGVMGIRAVPI